MESQEQAIPAVAVEKPAKERWPSQIKFIVGNEAAERFSYYGMLSILAVYISGSLVTGGLNHSRDSATSIVHTFKFVNYFLPLFGAWLSDKIIGRYPRFFGYPYSTALGTVFWLAATSHRVRMEN